MQTGSIYPTKGPPVKFNVKCIKGSIQAELDFHMITCDLSSQIPHDFLPFIVGESLSQFKKSQCWLLIEVPVCLYMYIKYGGDS